ncbi:hypothetical protein [uncultured Treponema sp.]|uniref:hypothetical protein n=1 Tax=uncultured Treponema sp. TaxID=162155 RepID=UPI0025F4C93D|nr:hypothetical protein [uncultured Treponema sp.]
MNNMISDINHNAGRNIDIIEDRIRQLKAVVAEADRHIELAKREIESQKANLAYKQKIDEVVQSKKRVDNSKSAYNPVNRSVQQYMRNQNLNISAALQSGNAYELTEKGNIQAKNSPHHQGDLFDMADADSSKQIVSDAGTTFTVESDGSSYASVPVIGGKVTYADEPVQPHKSFAQLVRDLNSAGHSVEEIASELDSSITEVQLCLDMDLGF